MLSLLIIFCLWLSFSTKNEAVSEKAPIILVEKKIKLNPAYHVFSLNDQYVTLFVEDIKKQIKFFGMNGRPDAKKNACGVLAGLNGSFQKKFLNIESKYYLKYQKGDLIFSETMTSLWIKVHDIKNNGVFIKVFLASPERVEGEDLYHSHVIFQSFSNMNESALESNLSHEAWFQSVDHIKWWGKDRFIELYGAHDTSQDSEGQRLDFQGLGLDFLFVKELDLLIWKNNRWQKPLLQEETQNYPLISCRLNPPYMELTLFDISGVYQKKIKLSLERAELPSIKMEEILTRLRQKGFNKVICKMGKKTVLLKEGDWVLKTLSGWKVLKSCDEIDQYLNFSSKGELFVFERIDTDNNETFVVGHLLDSLRTQVRHVKIPLSKTQKNKQFNSKKKINLSKLENYNENSSEEENDLEPLDEEELLQYGP